MSKCRKSRGSAMVETAFMMPWLAFLFIGILDVGFFSYASICTQEAARVAAIQVSTQGAAPCTAALGAMNGLPNMIGVVTCASSPAGVTATLPVAVVAKKLTNSTTPACADCAVSPAATSEQVVVTYQSIPLIPIPGILMGQLTLTRTAEARILQ